MGKSRPGSRPAMQLSKGKRGAAPNLLRISDEMNEMAREERKPLFREFEARSEAQSRYAHMIATKELVFGLGPAGVGKTWVVAALAAKALMDKAIDRIIITRPMVEAGEPMGFLPGTDQEKFEPYFLPFKGPLEAYMGKGTVEYMLKANKIIALPLALMRGHSFDGAFVVLDEAQNTTPNEMKMFLTRLGEGTNCVVSGDIRQKDITGPSGLRDAIIKLVHLPAVGVMRFTVEDIVRSGLVQEIVSAYEGEIEIDHELEDLLDRRG